MKFSITKAIYKSEITSLLLFSLPLCSIRSFWHQTTWESSENCLFLLNSSILSESQFPCTPRLDRYRSISCYKTKSLWVGSGWKAYCFLVPCLLLLKTAPLKTSGYNQDVDKEGMHSFSLAPCDEEHMQFQMVLTAKIIGLQLSKSPCPFQ